MSTRVNIIELEIWNLNVTSSAFMCHHNTFLVYQSMRNATLERWEKVTHISIGFAWLVAALFGIAGYATFRALSQGGYLVSVAIFFPKPSSGRALSFGRHVPCANDHYLFILYEIYICAACEILSWFGIVHITITTTIAIHIHLPICWMYKSIDAEIPFMTSANPVHKYSTTATTTNEG